MDSISEEQKELETIAELVAVASKEDKEDQTQWKNMRKRSDDLLKHGEIEDFDIQSMIKEEEKKLAEESYKEKLYYSNRNFFGGESTKENYNYESTYIDPEDENLNKDT